MAILDINISQRDRKFGKVSKEGQFHFTDLNRGIEMGVGLIDELIDDPVAEKPGGTKERCCQQQKPENKKGQKSFQQRWIYGAQK